MVIVEKISKRIFRYTFLQGNWSLCIRLMQYTEDVIRLHSYCRAIKCCDCIKSSNLMLFSEKIIKLNVQLPEGSRILFDSNSIVSSIRIYSILFTEAIR